MKRLIVLAGVTASALVVAGIAAATPPTRTTQSLNVSGTAPAGTFCDFDLMIDSTINQETTTYSDGRVEIHGTARITYTNLDTSAVVTGVQQVNGHFDATGGGKDTGALLKLRDASGKLVEISAGKIVYNSSFQPIDFTPNADPDFKALICNALGGDPAP